MELQVSASVSGTENTERRREGARVRDDRIDQIKEHLYSGLAMMDLVGHIEELDALWRRDSVAYAMRLAFQEWKAADALLSSLEEEELQEPWCSGSHLPSLINQGEERLAEEPPYGNQQ
jgi:hypothetical protein